jgi:hypothetical protein
MNRWFAVAFLLAASVPTTSSALELKNMRACYGPMGVTRYDRKLLPGDMIFMTFDIEDLAIDKKTGKASYVTILELIDSQDKVVFKKETPNEVIPQLGGNRIPGDLHLIMGPKQAAGKYAVKLTVHDKLGMSAKAFRYDFDLLPPSFGMVAVTAPAIGFPGQHYVPGFALVNFALDKKDTPDALVTIRILDSTKNQVAPQVEMVFPRDLPPMSDLSKENFVPLTYPVYLNRTGQFYMEITATDKLGNRKADLRFPFTVIDINAYTTGK